MKLGVTLRGLQKAQRGMLQALAAVKPEGGLGRALKYTTMAAHRFLVSVTHVDTGSYRAAQLPKQEKPTRFRLYISPAAVNPKSGQKPAVYGPYEEARGGDHAAYERTYHKGHTLVGRAASMLIRELP